MHSTQAWVGVELMSVMGAGTAGQPGTVPEAAGEPRVRELARDAITLMAFSAAVSVSMAVLLLLAYGVGR